MKIRIFLLIAVTSVTLAAPSGAQNKSAEAPVVIAPPPPPIRTETPPAGTPASPSPSQPAPEAPVTAPEPPAETVVIVPEPRTTPSEPMSIDPDAAYPQGFGDPADPFANDMALSYRESGDGFDWGLLGLLGLLGLIPLFRQRGSRTVYIERDDDEPRRVVRRRIDE